MRLDVWFRTTKSRRLSKLHKSKDWKQASSRQRQAQEKSIIDQLQTEKQKRLDDLETEWTKKVEEGDLDEDEDDKLGVENPTVDDEVGADDNEIDWTDEDQGIPGAEVERVIREHKSTWKSLIKRLEHEAKGKSR